MCNPRLSSRASCLMVVALAAVALPATGVAQRPREAARRPPAARSVASIVERTTPATVTIVTFDAAGDSLGQGSGFIVRPDGIIVTNWHVMRGASRAIVILASREQYDRVRFVDGDSAADIAILRIPAVDLPTVPTRTSVPEPGERVVVIGSPLGLSHTVTDGIVSALRMYGGKELVQITAAISPGSSGGAVLDASGRAFALATLYIEGGQQLNFAVPVRYALGLLRVAGQDRDLAKVFASPGAQPSAGAESASSRPSASASPRPSLVGVYECGQSWAGTGRYAGTGGVEAGFLIAASDYVGWFVLAPYHQDSSLGRVSVYNVRTFRTNESGQVVLQAGGLTYDGYQTDSGVYLEARDSDATYVLSASTYTFALSARSGVYGVSIRTDYIADGTARANSYTDWSGVAAIVTANDSVFLDLYVTNTLGGSSLLTGKGPLYADGEFYVTPYKGSLRQTRFSGRFAGAGVIAGNWSDVRDGGRFEGQLTATRQ
jgi:hypothetical protein